MVANRVEVGDKWRFNTTKQVVNITKLKETDGIEQGFVYIEPTSLPGSGIGLVSFLQGYTLVERQK